MLTLPFTSDPSQGFIVQLGESGKFRFDARYNDTASYWTFDLTRDADDTVLITGVPILIGQDILAPYALGIGCLMATDQSGDTVDAGPDNLGDRVTVSWLSPEERDLLISEGAIL